MFFSVDIAVLICWLLLLNWSSSSFYMWQLRGVVDPVILCPLHPLVYPFCTKGNIPTTIYHYSTVCCIHCILCPLWNCIHCILCPLHPLVWPFLHQRQYPHHHISLFHCVLHPLHTVSIVYCVHCVHCMPYIPYIINLFPLTKGPPHQPMLLITHETIMNQKLVISNQYLMSPPPTKKVPKNYQFFHCVANLNCLGNSPSHQQLKQKNVIENWWRSSAWAQGWGLWDVYCLAPKAVMAGRLGYLYQNYLFVM